MEILQRPATVWIILLCSLILTFAAWRLSDTFVRERAQDRFHFQTEDAHTAISQRLVEYESILRTGIGLFHASNNVSREEWRTFVNTVAIDQYFPGIQGIGYSVAILPDALESHIQVTRAEGFPDYSVRPEGARDFYTAILYLEPFDWRNQRAFGYDMFADPTRREAMTRARDSGRAATSGMVTLVQETDTDVQYGFLMYLPLYKKGMPIENVDERRAALQGFVYSAFRIKDLMQNILGAGMSGLRFRIYDGPAPSSATLMYDSEIDIVQTSGSQDIPSDFRRSMSIEHGGRVWTLMLYANILSISEGERHHPLFVAIGGGVIDLLLFLSIASIARQRRRAEILALAMTATVRQRESLLAEKAAALEEANKTLLGANEELTRLAHASKSASHAKSEFLANMSHELRTPLNAIIGFSDIIAREVLGPESNPHYLEYARTINDSGHHLLDIVNDILDASAIEAGQLNLHPDWTDIHLTAKAAVRLVAARAQSGKLTIAIAIQDSMPRILVDERRLKQILLNLLTNAIKFTPEGGSVEISIRHNEADDIAEIAVRDTGIGMDQDGIRKALSPFGQVDSSLARRYEGTGLGLPLTHALAQAHGGDLEIVSHPGQGTTVTIRLPVKGMIGQAPTGPA